VHIGGKNLGARPMELVLMGTGACTAIDVMHILRKARQPVTDCVVELEADRAEEDPKVFTAIRLRYIVTGRGLAVSQVEKMRYHALRLAWVRQQDRAAPWNREGACFPGAVLHPQQDSGTLSPISGSTKRKALLSGYPGRPRLLFQIRAPFVKTLRCWRPHADRRAACSPPAW